MSDVVNVNEEMNNMKRYINAVNQFTTLMDQIQKTVPMQKSVSKVIIAACVATGFMLLDAIMGTSGMMVFIGIVLCIYAGFNALGEFAVMSIRCITYAAMVVLIIATLICYYEYESPLAPVIIALVVWGLVGISYMGLNSQIKYLQEQVDRVR